MCLVNLTHYLPYAYSSHTFVWVCKALAEECVSFFILSLYFYDSTQPEEKCPNLVNHAVYLCVSVHACVVFLFVGVHK